MQQSQYSVWRLPFMAIIQTPHVQTNWIDHIYIHMKAHCSQAMGKKNPKYNVNEISYTILNKQNLYLCF